MRHLIRTALSWLRWFGGVVLLTLVGGYYLWAGGYALARDAALAGNGPVASATVVGQDRNTRGPGIHTITVEFDTVDGRPVRGTVYEFRDPAPAVGATIPVRYDPQHPNRYVRDASQGPTLWKPVLFLPLGLLFLVGDIFILARGRPSSGD
jgi:hypothetical protein